MEKRWEFVKRDQIKELEDKMWFSRIIKIKLNSRLSDALKLQLMLLSVEY